ncbi:hypothetical protein GWE18_00165 [Bradyrhizobium sp. CSA112]|uniref:hypothetical protein n=1 Tax=Bradyrhizobium sp. CSA112 TaxID=2699170 RepID=UPI0023B05250|nr:hypothetical protein [Bradyrhizobium sp. CSA112]MDE5451290.1 hypothetical protein [Bradyrhizobium sp. CSA112]
MIEKQKTESPTQFTLRLIRAEIIEQCAKVAEDAIPSIRTHYGVAESVGAQIAANRIRALSLPPSDRETP